MIILDDTTVIVFDTDDLSEAVSSDNGIDFVYFGADITLAYGITIYPGKTSLVFDGTYLGVTYTFTDMSGVSSANTIGIRSESSITITFQNINLIGRNYYGIPFVPNSSLYINVSTLYDNVTYNGPQINHNPYGFTSFTDCDITVNSHEAAGVSRIEIGGETTIVKTVADNAVFWFYGTSSIRPYMKIISGAKVSITTAHYFMYENNSPDYIIESGASLTLITNSGISFSASHRVNSFLVDTNASFWFSQAANRSVPTLCIDGALTVNDSASFYMQADFSNTNRLIYFTSSSSGLYINNPKSFVLYNRGNSLAYAFNFATAIPITISGGQVNFWNTAMQFPEAGTFEDEPQRKWNRPSYDRFTLTGTASNSGTNITYNDFTPEELADLPPLTDLQLHGARVFSVGDLRVTVFSTVISRQITGLTEPHANVMVVFIPSYYADPNTVIADDAGLFALVPTSPVPFSDYVEVFSNTPFLIVSVVREVYAEEELFIKYAPLQISFPVKPIAEFDEIILPRDFDNRESPVVVVDTRADKTDWQLWVNISEPLKTDENDILTDGVVFAIQNGELETVGSELKSIHVDHHLDSDEYTVTWNENRGVLVRVTVPMRSGKRYTTQLGWAVSPVGIEPGEEEIWHEK